MREGRGALRGWLEAEEAVSAESSDELLFFFIPQLKPQESV